MRSAVCGRTWGRGRPPGLAPDASRASASRPHNPRVHAPPLCSYTIPPVPPHLPTIPPLLTTTLLPHFCYSCPHPTPPPLHRSSQLSPACALPWRAPTPAAWQSAWGWTGRGSGRRRRRGGGRRVRTRCWRRRPAWTTRTGVCVWQRDTPPAPLPPHLLPATLRLLLPASAFRYKDCQPLMLSAPGGAAPWRFPGVRELLKPHPPVAIDAALLPPPPGGGEGQGDGEGGASAAVEPRRPLSTAALCNQVRLAQRAAIRRYYEGRVRSDDETAPCEGRNVCLAVREDAAPGMVPPDLRCTGHMRLVVGEGELYTQVGGTAGMGLVPWGGALPFAGRGGEVGVVRPGGWAPPEKGQAGRRSVWNGAAPPAGRPQAAGWLRRRQACSPPGWRRRRRPPAPSPPPPGLPPPTLIAVPPLPVSGFHPVLSTRSCPTCTACLMWRACCTPWITARRRRQLPRSWPRCAPRWTRRRRRRRRCGTPRRTAGWTWAPCLAASAPCWLLGSYL